MKKHLDVVAALILQDRKMLLSQRKAEDAYPLVWEFPGGCVEAGETELAAIEREIDEELGLKVKAGSVVGVFEDEDASLHISVKLLACVITGGKPFARDCQAWGFFDASSASALDLGPVDRKIFLELENRHYFDR